jgi:transposase
MSTSRQKTSQCILYVGLDVHKESVTIAVLPESAAAPTQVDKLPHDLKVLRRYFARLAERGVIRACYEASGAGYVLQRALMAWGYHCDVIAPSLIPRKPGHQRKHDRYDAKQLARYYRSGELTPIRIPTEAEERVRDLVRCRTTFQRQLLRARHFVLKFLTRRGLRYTTGKCHWTRAHHAWLEAIARGGVLVAEDQVVFSEYLALLHYVQQRRDALDEQIEHLAVAPALATRVGWLGCFRGLNTPAAVTLATEVVEWRRFARATQLMAYVGLVPREASSADTERRGPITKAGNSHCRHVLVQAAWAYRHAPRVGQALARRQRGQPPAVITHAWKAQHRLHKLFHRIAARKGPHVAVVAVARELVGFLWAVMQDDAGATAGGPARHSPASVAA